MDIQNIFLIGAFRHIVTRFLGCACPSVSFEGNWVGQQGEDMHRAGQGTGCLPVVWSIGSRSNFMPPAALSQCSISESRKPRRKYLSYKMSNCFSNSFQFPTTSRRVSEKTISFCTNPIHIQLFIFKKFSSGMHHQRNVQGYSEAVRLQSFKNLVL